MMPGEAGRDAVRSLAQQAREVRVAGSRLILQKILLRSHSKTHCMTTITDEYMQQMLTKTKEYCIVLLRPGPKPDQPGVEKIIWEHARRNFSLRADGLLSIVCPVSVESNVNGLGIFNVNIEETKKIMDEDPAVKAGVFVYEVHPCRSFPGDNLPA